MNTRRKIQWGDASFPFHLFTADASTGQVFRNGKPAGCRDSLGYYRVQANDCRIVTHRLVWRLHYGEWPNGELDHINGNPGDNRICNLRIATSTENKFNRRVQKNSKTGAKGVFWDSGLNRWRIGVSAFGKRTYFTASSYINACVAAPIIRRLLHGTFARQEAA